MRELRVPLPGVRALATAQAALPRAARARIGALGTRLDALAQNLAHLNPAQVLERGYAIVARSDGVIVQDAAQLRPGGAVRMTFARGDAQATVTSTSQASSGSGSSTAPAAR
jgi:exonuclease VII large subunit